MVQKLKGMSKRPSVERSAMPVTMPGRAIGSTSSRVMPSRPKKRLRQRAAAASVPRTRAMAVATAATCTDSHSAFQMSWRSQATANQRRVRPGGGNW